MESDDNIRWRGVPLALDREWQAVFQATQEILDLAAPCPVCGSCSLHRWYDLNRERVTEFEGKKFIGGGGLWEWCSACRCYEHYSARIPEWWVCSLKVDASMLTHDPAAVEAARLGGISANE